MKRFVLWALAVIGVFGWAVKARAQPQAYSPGRIGYGGGASTNVLLQANPFVISGDWNPIVVSGAGTSGANGNYVLVSSNLVAGLPYAVWSNSVSAANTWRLVQNNTNLVPLSIFSNYWTLENTINLNFAYDIISPTPFGTWEISGSGGVPGVAPFPAVGTHQPDLITLSAAASGGTLTISPGFYDLQGYIWYPTNLTVIAYGAVISSMNGIQAVQPMGSFQMYGGTISNGAFWGPGSGSLLLRVDTCTNYVSLLGTKLFGVTDTLAGTVNSDNLTISVIGCELGTFWDVATFSRAANLSNVVFSAVGSKFYSITNGISTASAVCSPGANQNRISGCYIQQGPGFISGAGVALLNANSTNEVNGTVVITQNGLPKYQQSSGVLIVDGVPVDVSDYVGNVTFPASTFWPTNLATATPNMRTPWSTLPVAANTTFNALTGVDASGRYMQVAKMYVTNSAVGTIALTMPANVVSVGSTTVTRRSILEWQVYGGKATNCIITPIN